MSDFYKHNIDYEYYPLSRSESFNFNDKNSEYSSQGTYIELKNKRPVLLSTYYENQYLAPSYTFSDNGFLIRATFYEKNENKIRNIYDSEVLKYIFYDFNGNTINTFHNNDKN